MVDEGFLTLFMCMIKEGLGRRTETGFFLFWRSLAFFGE
jgi:hypothetical protein